MMDLTGLLNAGSTEKEPQGDMDLTGMLREGSLTDLTWTETGMKVPGEITFDPSGSKNPNNVKPEAQDQWGLGDISPIFEEDIAGTVDRHIPETDLGDVAPVVVFARDLMNKGASASVIDRELKANFTKDQMRQGLRGLKEMFAMDGIVGRIAIDSRGYDNCAKAMEAAKNSPYKRFIKFVIGCSCGDPHMIPVAGQKHEMVASSGNAADDFLADERAYVSKEVPHCRTTRLPLFSSVDDLDPSWVNDAMLVVENISGIPGDEASRIRMMDEKPIKKMQMAFKAMDKEALKKERSRYSEPVNASEYQMEVAENEIELCAEVHPSLDIDAAPGDFMGNEVPSILAEVEDVDMTIDSTGTIFEGSDEIELDEPIAFEADLEVDMDSELSW